MPIWAYPCQAGESEAKIGGSSGQTRFSADRTPDGKAKAYPFGVLPKTYFMPVCADFVFAFHDGDEIGPKMVARIAKHTGLEPKDL